MKFSNGKYIILFALLLTQRLFSQPSAALNGAHVGVEIGNWKPSALDDRPSNPFVTVPGASLYGGVLFATPSLGGFSVRFDILQWQQKDLAEIGEESVTLRQLTIDLKNALLAETAIIPYVSYGFAIIWSREIPFGGQDKVPLDKAGLGVQFGAGVDFQILKHWRIGAEYQYLYAKFARKVGRTDNYSGPKISLKLLYFF